MEMEMETETGKMRLVERLPKLDGKLLKLYVRYIDLSMLGYLIIFFCYQIKVKFFLIRCCFSPLAGDSGRFCGTFVES